MSTRTDGEYSNKMSIANRISLIPLRHTKTVHLIRHAQGFHNAAGEKTRTAYTNPKYMDAHLTTLGWEQARSLNRHLHDMNPALKVDLVVVSPMTRAMETACGVFGNASVSEDDPVLMAAQDSIEGVRSEHGSISTNGSPPLLAVELCREYVNTNHPCDKRRSISYYKLNFPGIDFSHVPSDEDTLWSADRESDESFQARIHSFLEFLRNRPEIHIAVVSHSGFLRALCRQFGNDLGNESRVILHKHFTNCEMRSIVMCDKFGSPEDLCGVSHPGGMAAINGYPPQNIPSPNGAP